MARRQAKAKAKARAKAKAKKGELPVWDLSHLVKAPYEENVLKGFRKAAARAAAFRKKHEGRVARLSPAAFGGAVAEYEDILCAMARVFNYANLDRQTKLTDPAAGRLYQTAMEKANDITAEMLFFRLEINKMSDAALKKMLSDETARRYRPYLDAVRAMRPYQLEDAVEKAVHERSVTGHPAWSRLFDEACASLRFPVGGKMLTDVEVLHMMSSSRERKKRKAAARALEEVLGRNAPTFGLILNTIAKEKEIDDRQRGFKTPVAARNLENQVEDEVVAALVDAVRARYPRLSHRYYKIKAKWLGMKRMDYWDRNAPLPFSAGRKIPWGEGKARVLKAYGDFHPLMAKTARRFFDEGWIHARPMPGKDSGAFSAPATPDVHPYILMNYKGEVGDVMTLAHELGHGVHQLLSAPQGYLMSDTPLTLAETASVFGEMLTFRSFLKDEKDAKLRRAVIADKVEDMLNTVVRQIAFHNFETAVHGERRKGELTTERIGAIFMEKMGESLGPAFRLEPGYRHFWTYISHFYHVPFYVYAYAFGDCLVNALYAVYENSPQGFAEKYIGLLRAGGTKRHAELLKPFGLDARDPAFWKKGLSVIEGLIDELE